MPPHLPRVAAICAAATIASLAQPAMAAIVITHTAALVGNVTPGDKPGFPITLSLVGSYVLGGNIVPADGTTGIVVTASDVTIDFQGFTLTGRGVASNGIDPIQSNLVIRNGTITGFTNDGVGDGYFVSVENMQIHNNGGDGVSANNSVRVVGSTLLKNGATGINCTGMCHIEGNMIAYNKLQGIKAGPGSLILGNTIFMNGGVGIEAPKAGYGNNTLQGNKAPQVTGALRLQPNACIPAPCP